MDENAKQWARMLEAQWSKPDGLLGKIREVGVSMLMIASTALGLRSWTGGRQAS